MEPTTNILSWHENGFHINIHIVTYYLEQGESIIASGTLTRYLLKEKVVLVYIRTSFTKPFDGYEFEEANLVSLMIIIVWHTAVACTTTKDLNVTKNTLLAN